MFLSPEQLSALTGAKRRGGQIRWLQAHGWRYTLSGTGAVIVASAEFEAQLVSGKATQPESAIRWGEVKDGRKAA